MSYKQLYRELVNYAKRRGIKVYHRSINDDYGHFNAPSTIVIDKDIKNTKLGCEIFAHELGHYYDYINQRFMKFYNADKKFEPIKTNLNLIARAEISASRNGRRIIKIYSNEEFYFRELDLKIRDEMMEIWKECYCVVSKD